MTNTDLLDKILKDINNIQGVKASVIASRDGLVIYSNMSMRSAGTIAAMSAAMMSAAEHASLEIENDSLDRVIAESRNGKIIVLDAGTKALLLIMTQPDINLGLILNELTKSSEQIKKILDGE